MGQGHELTDLGERGESVTLIRFQEGHDGVTSLSQVLQERCSHAFAIHNDAGVCRFPTSLFITSQHLGQSHRQMLVSTRSRGQAWMPLLIMQKRQRTPSQDFAGAPDESTRDEAVAVDGLAVSIDVKAGSRLRKRILALSFPQMGCPRAKDGGERFGPTSFGELTEKALRMAIPVGSMPSCHHCQCVSGVAAQVMCSMQAAQREEQQRQQQLAQAMWGTGKQRLRGGWLTRGHRGLQLGKQTRLMGGCQQQEPSGSFLNLRFFSCQIFFPHGW